MVLMATNGKIPKDRSWKQAKMMMAKVDAFLDALINYDKEHIHSDVIKVESKYLRILKAKNPYTYAMFDFFRAIRQFNHT